MPTPARLVAICLASLAFVSSVFFLVLRLVLPPPPPATVPLPAPLGAPLTRHVAFVVIDGLRYDVATDASRMPALARRMAETRSTEIWSGEVSVTSSAVMTYGTGQRGDIEQIIRNESGDPVLHNDIIQNARDMGLVTSLVGSRIWLRLYPKRWSMTHPDPEGVAIDVDYDHDIFEAAKAAASADPRPNLAVFHFVMPDHKAHAHGVFSERYTTYIRGFDRDLDALLEAMPKDTTVFVTSDHGTTDTGGHGTSTTVERRSPFLAFGPGITKARSGGERLDQVDIPGTLAALLGVPAPAHGRGHVLVDWLDVDDEKRAAIACADLDRLANVAKETAGEAAMRASGAADACKSGDPRARIAKSAAAAAKLDRAIGDSHVSPRFAWVAPLLVLALGLALARLTLGRDKPFGKASAVVVLLIALAVFAVLEIERLPGRFPDVARGALYVLAVGALLFGVFRRSAAAALLDRKPLLAAALVPGLIVVSETRTTQFAAFVLAAVIAGFALLVGLPRAPGAPPWPGKKAPWSRIALAFAIFVALFPLSHRLGGYLPQVITASPTRAFGFAIACIVAFPLLRTRAAAVGKPNPFFVAGLTAVVLASLWLRRFAPAPVCLVSWLGLGAVAVAYARRGEDQIVVELLAYASYAWVSRDVEVPYLVATHLVAAEVGEALRGEGRDERPLAPSLVLVIVAFVFSWAFVQQVGIAQGIDFINLDWGAAAFRQEGVSISRVGAAIFYKHGVARAALVAAVLVPLAPRLRIPVAQGLFLSELTRSTLEAAMLYVCRKSFFTAFRILGDAPHTFLATVIAAAAYGIAVTASRKPESSPEAALANA